MIIEKPEIEVTSLVGSSSASSETSPKRDQHCNYYVQSPSRDSNESLTNSHTSPTFTSPNESPSRSSQSRSSQSRISSSESRVSGPYPAYALAGKHHRHHHSYRKRKGWPPLFSVIDEEDEDYDYEKQFMQSFRFLMIVMASVMVLTAFCFITWGASRPYKLQVQMKSWKMNNFYYGEGSDRTGVPTKLLTINCTVKMNIRNPATFFGVHVASASLNLFYSQILIGSGQFMNYYQPKKSRRTVSVNVEGRGVPLYGAGMGLVMSRNDGVVPLKLEFVILSEANLVGKLVTSKNRCRVFCLMEIDSENSESVEFKRDSCSYG